ncbi:MAG: NAD(+) synthase, partial [Acidimicrobiia bacterium]|nr:NAD(+) synthase [Acidimicrobiia bacterium]
SVSIAELTRSTTPWQGQSLLADFERLSLEPAHPQPEVRVDFQAHGSQRPDASGALAPWLRLQGQVRLSLLCQRCLAPGSINDAELLARNLGIDIQTVSIEPAFSAYLAALKPSFADRQADLTEENLQSRVRGTTLMALSNKFGWMVLTTGNKSEIAVGYFTLYGDSVGGYAVIKDLFKTKVYEICAFFNQQSGRDLIPTAIINKAPSAELRPDQRDDQSLPPYDQLDPILELYVEDDLTAQQIVDLGYDSALVKRIARLVDMNEYKRRQGAPGVRISTKAFGKDRRLPITNKYSG